jgi:hypothetical protein
MLGRSWPAGGKSKVNTDLEEWRTSCATRAGLVSRGASGGDARPVGAVALSL